MKALVILLALAGSAHAYPVFVAEEQPSRDPTTKLGFRLGFGRVPLAEDTLGWSAITLGVEHAVSRRLRVLAEYDYLWLSVVPEDPEMPSSFTSTGHRTHVGLRYEALSKDLDMLKFYADVEAGAGLGLYDAPAGAVFVPHGFVGARIGYQLRAHGARASRTFEPEILVRAIVVEHGIGLGGGLGFCWGD